MIFRQVQYKDQYTDPASDHKDSNPTNLALRLLWLSTISQSN
jgi:hypothetical protein